MGSLAGEAAGPQQWYVQCERTVFPEMADPRAQAWGVIKTLTLVRQELAFTKCEVGARY